MHQVTRIGALLLGMVLGACGGHKSPSGFRLPDGDVEQGRAAFLDLRCNACHRVAGVDLPPPVAEPAVPVVLGAPVPAVRTDGDLVTAIIHPSHRIAPGYPAELVRSGEGSRMPEYGDIMTVRQLVDLVAFLHSRYEVVPPAPIR